MEFIDKESMTPLDPCLMSPEHSIPDKPSNYSKKTAPIFSAAFKEITKQLLKVWYGFHRFIDNGLF